MKVEQIDSISSDTAFNGIDIDDATVCSAHVKWSNGSGFSATLVLQVSNDKQRWEDVSSQAISGASGGHMFDIETGASFVRVNFTSVAGSADINHDFVAKVIRLRR